MTIDLRLRVLGLCAYVPEDSARMHLLLPHMNHAGHGEHRGGSGGGESDHDSAVLPLRDGPARMLAGPTAGALDPDRHYPRLMYDIAHLRPNQSEFERHYEVVTLEGRVLDLTGLQSAEGFEPRLPRELPDLKDVSEPVPTLLVRELPKGRLGGRVTMSRGALTNYALGASFFLNHISTSGRMAYETEWTIRGIEAQFDSSGNPHLPLLLIDGPEDGDRLTLGPLYPIAQTVHLTIFNVVSTAFPPDGALFRVPRPTESTRHFLAYHSLSSAKHNPPRKPVAAPVVDVLVRGDVPKPIGPHLPGVICVQVQTKLA